MRKEFKRFILTSKEQRVVALYVTGDIEFIEFKEMLLEIVNEERSEKIIKYVEGLDL